MSHIVFGVLARRGPRASLVPDDDPGRRGRRRIKAAATRLVAAIVHQGGASFAALAVTAALAACTSFGSSDPAPTPRGWSLAPPWSPDGLEVQWVPDLTHRELSPQPPARVGR